MLLYTRSNLLSGAGAAPNSHTSKWHRHLRNLVLDLQFFQERNARRTEAVGAAVKVITFVAPVWAGPCFLSIVFWRATASLAGAIRATRRLRDGRGDVLRKVQLNNQMNTQMSCRHNGSSPWPWRHFQTKLQARAPPGPGWRGTRTPPGHGWRGSSTPLA